MQRRTIALTLALGFALMFASSAAVAQYQLTNLVSNQVGQAKHTDPLLVNAGGLTYGPGGPFWISDTGSGWSTLYTGGGVKQSLQVTVPSVSGQGPGLPTGIVFNGSQEFQVQGWAAIFLFATLYTGGGVKQGLQVTVPSVSGQGPGLPTGIVFNGSQEFQVQGWAAIFLFATLDGTISGWAPQSN